MLQYVVSMLNIVITRYQSFLFIGQQDYGPWIKENEKKFIFFPLK